MKIKVVEVKVDNDNVLSKAPFLVPLKQTLIDTIYHNTHGEKISYDWFT